MAKRALFAATLSLLLVAPALAQPDQPDVLPKEFACMSGQTKYASKFWLAKTNNERKIASSDTVIVSSGNGNGSKGERPGIIFTFASTQNVNHTT